MRKSAVAHGMLQCATKTLHATSGNDGLFAEVCIRFWTLLGQQLTESLIFSFEHGALYNSQRRAIIKLIDNQGIL